MSSTVCIDASLVVRLLVPTEETEEVERHWLRWIEEGRTVVAPGLIAYESRTRSIDTSARGI